MKSSLLLIALAFVVQVSGQTCGVCSHVYDADADGGGLAFEDLPDDWRCPVCGSPKSVFNFNKEMREWVHREIDTLADKAQEAETAAAAAAPSCGVCGHVYDADADGDGLAFEDLADDWRCPVCGSPKSAFTYNKEMKAWFHEEVAAITQAVEKSVQCPGSPAGIHCGGTIESVVEAPCSAVVQEVEDRVAGANGWIDSHNNGMYNITSRGDGSLALSRVTGDLKYTDLITMAFTDAGTSCAVSSCSESQVFSIGDFSTNYCNQRLLLCGSAQGCRTANLDAAYNEGAVTTLASASTNANDCLAV